MRNIVFINQATGYLTIDILNEFSKCGEFDDVSLIAGSIRVQDIPMDKSIKWRKIPLYNRGNPRKKFVSWLVGALNIYYLLLTKYRKHEVFFITIPPFAYLFGLFLQRKFSILVFDVYPDILKIYNISEKNIIYKTWEKLNRRIFKKAFKIYTIGQGMSNLLKNYVPEKKITIVPNWTGLINAERIPKSQNNFLKQYGLEGKFIVQYSGNIGMTHNVEVIIDIAKELQSDTDIFFMIIGRGDRYQNIEHLINQSNLDNILLLPFQPDEIINQSLSAADLGIVLLDDKTAHVSVPSKIYNLHCVGTPILGIAKKSSELHLHIKSYDIGICFEQEEKHEIGKYIVELKNNPNSHKKLIANSVYASQFYTNKNAKSYLDSYLQND